nr:TPA_asm: RNA-dependent RNA polymerase [Victorivirus fimbriatae]
MRWRSFGLSPGIIAHGAEEKYMTASSVAGQLSDFWSRNAPAAASAASASNVASGQSASAATTATAAAATAAAAATGSSRWGTWGKLAIAAGGAAVVAAGAGAAWYNRDNISSGIGWVGEHPQLPAALANPEDRPKPRAETIPRQKEQGKLGSANTDRSFPNRAPRPPPRALPGSRSARAGGSPFYRALTVNGRYRDECFPHKKHSAARTKPHLALGALIRSWAHVHGMTKVEDALAAAAGRLTADQATAYLMYDTVLRPHLGPTAWQYALALIVDPARAKGLSGALKALGWNCTVLGAAFVEANVLAGRGIGAVDWEKEISRRTDQAAVDSGTVHLDEDRLRGHVRALFRAELPRAPVLPDMDDWWTARWGWCVNGAQTTRSLDSMGVPRDALSQFKRVYRRMASECLDSCPVYGWDGTTSVSASEKLEHGKTRAIFACDTTSYFAWSYLLNPVGKSWQNSRVLLDPGRGGSISIARRILKARSCGSVNLMMDFDDFNSQHSTESMKIVTEELCSYVNAPPWLADVLRTSLDREYIHHGGQAHHVKGTLMSGHRGTTFFNSVLNYAYIREAYGPSAFDACFSLHTGDDVYMRLPTLAHAATLLSSASALGCRLNPSKQSVGFHNAEFLRMGISPARACGYPARSIATLSSGSWTVDAPPTPLEGITTIMTTLRSLINRTGSETVAAVAGPAVKYLSNTSAGLATSLCRGQVSLNTLPVFTQRHTVRRIKLPPERLDPMQLTGLPLRATTAYLTNHASEVEVAGLEMTGMSPAYDMAASSYRKGLDHDAGILPVAPALATSGNVTLRGMDDAASLVTQPPKEGVLSRYPLLQLIRPRLGRQDLLDLLGLCGVAHSSNPELDAWGPDSRTVISVESYPSPTPNTYPPGPTPGTSSAGLATSLCRGQVSLNTLPVFTQRHTVRRIKLPPERLDPMQLTGLPLRATTAYLTNHASEVEVAGLEMTGMSPAYDMAASSYRKGLDHDAGILPVAPALATSGNVTLRGMDDAASLVTQPPKEGVLSRYPLLQLIRPRLGRQDLLDLLGLCGVAHSSNPELDAWGPDSRTVNIRGVLPFADAQYLSARTDAGHIYVTYPIGM